MPLATSERLAQALHAAGLLEMETKAREGYYDDYKSPLATPITQLVNDLNDAGQFSLAKRAMDGEFDGTKEEGEAWMKRFSPG